MKMIKQLEKEIEEMTYHKDHKTCNECDFCVDCWESNSIRATLTQTNEIIKLIEDIKKTYVKTKVSDYSEGFSNGWISACEKLLAKLGDNQK